MLATWDARHLQKELGLTKKLLSTAAMVTILVAVGSSSPALAASHVSIEDVFDFTPALVDGSSKVVRTKNGINFSIETSGTGIFPGHAYTVWVVVFNFPENCIVPFECTGDDLVVGGVPPLGLPAGADVLYGGGNIATGVGTLSVGQRVGINDLSHFPGVFSDLGLEFPLTAEIHLVPRGHGPKVPEQMPAQIHSFAGGCFFFLDPPAVADEVGECADVQFSVHRP